MSLPSAPRVADRLRAAGVDWIVPDWPAPSRVQAFATTRNGGASGGPYATMNLGRRTDDDPAALAENLRRLAAYLPSMPVWLEQVHGTAVATLGASAPAASPIADAAVTREPGVVCAVLIADCLPVLFASRAGTAVGVAHAGWRGLAAGVLEATVSAMRVEPGRIRAWLGPAIGAAHFEVGDEVRAAFLAHAPDSAGGFTANARGRWQCDLALLA